MATITRGATTIAPTLVMGYVVESEVPTVIHNLLAGGTALTLRAARTRTGTLHLFFSTYAAAWAAFTAHRTAGPLVLTDTDVPAASMTYVAAGTLTLTLEPETSRRWILDVPYAEVA